MFGIEGLLKELSPESAAYWFARKNEPNFALCHAPASESGCGDVSDDLATSAVAGSCSRVDRKL
jgi:hypothetical protein